MPGLYVEDGWMSKYITHVTPMTKDECVTDGGRSVTNEENVTSDDKTNNDASVTKSDGDDKTNENGNVNNDGVEKAPNTETQSKDEDVAIVSVESETIQDKTKAEKDQKLAIDKR